MTNSLFSSNDSILSSFDHYFWLKMPLKLCHISHQFRPISINSLIVIMCFTMKDHKHVSVAPSFGPTDHKNELGHISINQKPSKRRLFWIEKENFAHVIEFLLSVREFNVIEIQSPSCALSHLVRLTICIYSWLFCRKYCISAMFL